MVTSCSIDFKYSTWFCYIFISLLKSEEERAQVFTQQNLQVYWGKGKIAIHKNVSIRFETLNEDDWKSLQHAQNFFQKLQKMCLRLPIQAFQSLYFKAKNTFFFLDRGINTTSKGRRKKN